jgi:anti-sigma regulatory factor (Ser/Thr protein kinase)
VSVARDPGGEAATGDAIRLRIPHARPYHGVARLVVGGLAARLDFSYEHLEDLQLALASILENEAYRVAEDVTVEVTLEDDGVLLAMGPLDGAPLRADLESDVSEGIGLGRLLDTLAEHVEIEDRDGREWLRLEKRVLRTTPDG